MVGMGSGSWLRYSSKSTVDTQHAVDIRYLKKHDLLRTGHYGSLSWSCRGKPTGSIQYRIEKSGITLIYKARLNAEEWKAIKQFVPFDYTPCHYGGKRTWLLCPTCNKRVICIYGAGTYFSCRHCYNLNFQSQHEDHHDRQMSKTHGIRKKLGGEPGLSNPFPNKPKGMHWKTYLRLYQQAMYGEQCFMQKAERLLGKNGF